MITKTRALGALAVGLLVSLAAPGGGGGVRTAVAEQVRACGPVSRGSDACDSPLPVSGPSLTPASGGQPSPEAGPGSSLPVEYDACYLVADSEMEALFHRELAAPPSGTRAGGVHDCLWSFDPEGMEMAVVWLGAYIGCAELAGLGADAIAGVGDEALWVLDGQLWVRIGDTAITVMVISETLDAEDAAIAIARLAVPRIR